VGLERSEASALALPAFADVAERIMKSTCSGAANHPGNRHARPRAPLTAMRAEPARVTYVVGALKQYDRGRAAVDPVLDRKRLSHAVPTMPYSITLHRRTSPARCIGHALSSTMQDILIRWKRMQNQNAM
jgi:hypothetical protein